MSNVLQGSSTHARWGVPSGNGSERPSRAGRAVSFGTMRSGIAVEVTAADRDRLHAIVANRNSPQKHVWRAAIVLATADGLGTSAVMRLSIDGRNMRPSSVQAELEAEIGRLRDLLEREKAGFPSRRGTGPVSSPAPRRSS